MAKTSDKSRKGTGLRRQVEELLRMTKPDVAAMPVKYVQRLLHELQVHQIELELQNDELRRTQAQLEVARDRYMDLYDNAPTGYLTLNPKGMILEANLPACTLLGINRKDVFGKPVIGFVAAKDQVTFLRHLREMVHIGVRQVCEVDLVQQDDAPVSVQFESVAVQDEAGQHTRVLTALLDITKRRRAAEAFQVWQEGLEQQRRLEERERIGHDLHDGILQSLYAIGLSLDSVKMDPSQVSDKAAMMLSQNISELNSVMQEVRNFIKELGPLSHPEAAWPTFELSNSLYTMAETLARLYGRKVRVSIARDAVTGISHAEHLNLLNIAKEAISNSLRHTKASIVSVSLNHTKGNFRLTVQDNGIGFDLSRKAGHGHGLVNMAARAKALGGTLSIQSRPAKGTQVVLDFPDKSSMEGVKP